MGMFLKTSLQATVRGLQDGSGILVGKYPSLKDKVAVAGSISAGISEAPGGVWCEVPQGRRLWKEVGGVDGVSGGHL